MGRGNELERYVEPEVIRRKTSRGAKRLGSLVLAGTTVVGVGAWASTGDSPGKDNCTDVTHQLIHVDTQGFKGTVRGVMDFIGSRNDERSLTGVAKALTEQRGWYVSPERLAGANATAKFIVRDSDGTLQDRLPDGNFCANVPGEVPSGAYEVRDRGETFETIAEEQELDVKYLRTLNPRHEFASKKNTDPLPLGTTVRVDDEIDASFAYRPITGAEQNINSMGNLNMRNRILMANIALMGAGETPIKPGDVGYFPLKGGVDSNGKKYSPTDIIVAYGSGFKPINVENTQIHESKKPTIPKPSIKIPKVNPKKPVTPEKPAQPTGRLLERGPTVSHTTTGDPIPGTISGLKYFNQWDERWGRQSYEYKGGHGHTIITSGCGPSAIATVIANLAGTKTNPSIEAKWAKKHGYRVEGGTDHAAFTARPESVGLHAKHISRSAAAVRSITEKGGMVILNGEDKNPSTPATNHGHIYVVYKVTSGNRFLVLDSNSVTKSLKSWPADVILGVASDAVGVYK